MKLSAILTAERVGAGFTATSKKKALEELSRLLAQGAGLNETDILNGLSAREKLGSTGLGRGVAIPHGRLAGVKTSVGAFLRLKHAVDYDAHDGTPVDLIFGLIVPAAATEEHLRHLAAIAEKFSDDGFCKSARTATSASVLHALVCA